MDFNAVNANKLLEQFDFERLFIEELGWDRHGADLSVQLSSVTYTLRAVAEKRGMVAWVCSAPVGQKIPDRMARKKIETQVAKMTLEHLIVFTDAKRAEQIWCWARREAGKPASVPEHFWYALSGNRGFLQKLEAIAFSLSEENTLTLVNVTARARAAFDVERVTKRFYDQFKVEHKAFLDLIGGITELADKEWYASLMLNRLMFIYFMQRKGFLNGERDYLRDRLARSQKEKGPDKFYSFYRYFLLRLFHEGLGGRERNPELDKLLGRIPYLNGGLFEKHPIEERCPDIKIPDEAFTRIFAYFDRYQWHLDERPLRNDNEINPDVLGYIFEKYINQKQMGAYYTKEDITEYISKNTVIPFLFDAAKTKCKVAFENPGGPTIWDHLRDDPDRYIYTAVKHGCDQELPLEIAAGIDDISARMQWNHKAPANFGLPTEIWREVVARRSRYTEVRTKLAAAEVRDINDLITLNLDIRQFAQDVVERCEGPDLLRAFWKSIEGVTVLDPTCGSGAFLFAALDILEPLYDTCLDRMEAFVADLERSDEGRASKKFEDFKATLAKVGAHPNARYFTLKSIILNNLFGVDVMEEAVEICKLRLFLKLAAQVDPDHKHENLGIEPLPDIDFNIRCGNTLVGYATYSDLLKSAQGDLFREQELEKIKLRAADLQQTFDQFRARQVDGDVSVQVADKDTLKVRLKSLEVELSLQMAKDYGVPVEEKTALRNWIQSHQPFHWMVEFHGIMSAGGFDVIVGNPPYVEYGKLRDQYSIKNYSTEPCGNLYAYVMERCHKLVANGSRTGLIVPHSVSATYRSNSIQRLLMDGYSGHYSYFSRRPGKLFDGADQCLCIFIGEKGGLTRENYSTSYYRWYTEGRGQIFQLISYAENSKNYWPRFQVFPKIGHVEEDKILKILSSNQQLGIFIAKRGNPFYCHRISRYFIKATNFVPYFSSERDGEKRSDDFKEYFSSDIESSSLIICALNSSIFYWYWRVMFDGYHCGGDNIRSFPFSIDKLSREHKDALVCLAAKLMASFTQNAQRKSVQYKKTGLVMYDEFNVSKSKSILDEVDRVLGAHFGLESKQIDYLMNFEVKFRMSGEKESED